MGEKFDFGALDKPFEAEWPVTIEEPIDGGKTRSSELVVRFRQLTSTAVREILDAPDYDPRKLPRAYFIGFGRDVEHEWSEEVRDRLLNLPHVRRAIEEAYSGFTGGIAVKN